MDVSSGLNVTTLGLERDQARPPAAGRVAGQRHRPGDRMSDDLSIGTLAGALFSTRETVLCETPDAAAMSRMVIDDRADEVAIGGSLTPENRMHAYDFTGAAGPPMAASGPADSQDP